MAYNSSLDSRVKAIIRFSFILAVILVLGGCTEQILYSNLSEREANEMVALLYNKGIPASKSSNNDNTYSVLTPRESFSQSIELLRSNGFPKNQFESLGEVFKKEGFVSSPLEERARLNYAQSQELARTIESIDGVVLARVHLAIPEDNNLNEVNKPSSASVFLKHRRGVDLSGRESQIKALIVNSIEGLPYENVTVAMFSSDPIPVFSRSRESTNKQSIINSYSQYFVISLSLLVVLFGSTSIWLWLRYRRVKTGLNMTTSGQ
jgi:type III secretion protein J